MFDSSLLKLSAEVEAALREGRAVVALESTVISHGLPRPLNLETARRLEASVRDGGAVPATVAVLGGRLCVGLEDSQLERLAFADGVRKMSRRDLAVGVSRGSYSLRDGRHRRRPSRLAARRVRGLAGACAHASDRRLLRREVRARPSGDARVA